MTRRSRTLAAGYALLAIATLASALAACSAGATYDPRAESCGGCHATEHAEWSSSRLAAGAGSKSTSPVFQAMLGRVEAAWGSVARARCVSCHAPGFGGDAAIGCVTCHAATGNRGVANAAMVVDLDAPIATTRAPAGATPHATEVRGYLGSPDLCGTCHSVHGPGLFEETTYDELRTGGGGACVTCHMARGADGHVDHRFVGVDPPWGASTEARERAARDAEALIARALRLSLRSGDAGGTVVSLANVGGGHAVPTGVTFLRDYWVDVRVVDATGHAFELPRVLTLGARVTHNGAEVELPTDADRIEPSTIANGAAREVQLAPPAGAIAPLSWTATLRAKAIGDRAITALDLAARAFEVPLLEVATARL
jgi:hypothetical protein